MVRCPLLQHEVVGIIIFIYIYLHFVQVVALKQISLSLCVLSSCSTAYTENLPPPHNIGALGRDPTLCMPKFVPIKYATTYILRYTD